MTLSDRRNHSKWHASAIRRLLLLIAIVPVAFDSASTAAAPLLNAEYRVADANDKFDGTRQLAVAVNLRSPRRLRARHIELAFGSFSSAADDRAFVSFGPVWRLPIERRFLFVELGFSPTLLSDSRFNSRDLGGNFHFTSSIEVGATFGKGNAVSVSLRAQHTSNGGLHSSNPGIDMFGIAVAFNSTNQ